MDNDPREIAVEVFAIAVDALDEIVQLEDEPIKGGLLAGRAIRIAGNARRKIADTLLNAQTKKDMDTIKEMR